MLLALALDLAWADEVLPVRRVRFYESGVAWYERAGVATSGTTLPVPRSHLDDALKTLVILGGDVDVGAITFASSRPDTAARALAGLSEEPSYVDVLRSLRGARVTVRTRDERTLDGTLVQVEGPLAVVGDGGPARAAAEEHAITVLAADGGLHRVLTSELSSIRATDPAIAARLDEAARALSGAGAQDTDPLGVQLRRGGELAIGYLAEAPVWRVSYRLADPDQGQADLQAWALVHNDTDEAWKGVQVELVNGQPDSFLYPLAAPRYAERALVTPDVHLSSVPQLANDTPDGMWDEEGVGYGVAAMDARGYGVGGGGSAMGIGGVGSREARASLQQAEAVETPTQFVYKVARPVDLPARHSALVPIVDDDIDAEAAVVVGLSDTPQLGLWVKNDTRRTLPEGLVTVLEAGGLGGEAKFERMKPDEDQLVVYGTELDVDATVGVVPQLPQVKRVSWGNDRLTLDVITPRTVTVDVRNRSGRARSLWLDHALQTNDTVGGGARVELDRFRDTAWLVVQAPAGPSSPEVTITRSTREARDPLTVDAVTYRAWADAKVGDPASLRAAADAREALDATTARLAEARAALARTEQALAALRKDLEAAGTDATALARRAAATEGDAARLRERIATIEAELKAGQEAVRAALSGGGVGVAVAR